MEWAKAEIEASRDSVLAEAASHIATAAETVFARDGGGAGNGGDGSLDGGDNGDDFVRNHSYSYKEVNNENIYRTTEKIRGAQ